MPLVLGINVAKAEQPPPPCHPNPNAPADETTVRNRGDIVNLPGPLKDRLAQLANRPHTYLPIQAFAEAHNDDGSPKPSRSMACLPDRFSTLVEGAVSSELVSGSQIPCYAGKIQGISSTLTSVTRICRRNGDYNQSLTSKFPTRRNRELIDPYQGIKSAYQGSFVPDQGRALGSAESVFKTRLDRALGRGTDIETAIAGQPFGAVLARQPQDAGSSQVSLAPFVASSSFG
jgi:hypothetical protein